MGKLLKLKENKHGLKFLTYLEGTLSGGFFFLCKNAKKGVRYFYFGKNASPSCFFSCETYPRLEVSMGEKMKEKKEKFGRWFTLDNTPSPLLGCYPTLLFFLLKKKKHTFVSWKTPEERELDKFYFHVLLPDWACHAPKRPMRWSGKG